MRDIDILRELRRKIPEITFVAGEKGRSLESYSHSTALIKSPSGDEIEVDLFTADEANTRCVGFKVREYKEMGSDDRVDPIKMMIGELYDAVSRLTEISEIMKSEDFESKSDEYKILTRSMFSGMLRYSSALRDLIEVVRGERDES